MLEKLAELVREEVKEAGYGSLGVEVEVPCYVCDRKPFRSQMCGANSSCPTAKTTDGSLMLARWAVLLVAKGLKKELEGVQKAWEELFIAHDKDDADRLKKADANYLIACKECAVRLNDLAIVAKEGANG